MSISKESFLIDCCNKARNTFEELNQKPSLSQEEYQRYRGIVSRTASLLKSAEKEYGAQTGAVSTLLQAFRDKVSSCVTSLELHQLPVPSKELELRADQKEDANRLSQIQSEIEGCKANYTQAHVKLKVAKTRVERQEQLLGVEIDLLQRHKQIKENSKGLDQLQNFATSDKERVRLESALQKRNKTLDGCKKEKADVEFDIDQGMRSFKFLVTRFNAEYEAIKDPTVRWMFKKYKTELEDKNPMVEPAPQVAVAKAIGTSLTITVTQDVGFGNFISLRGDGEDMSWDEGIPLTCTGNNQWTIKIPADKEFSFKLLLNDRRWQEGADMIARPGKPITIDTVQFQAEKIKMTG